MVVLDFIYKICRLNYNNKIKLIKQDIQQIQSSMKKLEQQTPTPQEVLVNPLNNSSSKYQFSFSKAQRFNSSQKKNVKTQIDDSYHFYNIPSTISKKAAGFGIGQKNVVFNIKSDVPPATRYTPTVQGNFDHYAKKQNQKSKGFSFTIGRENMKSLSFIRKNQNPGPGNYDPDPQKIMSNSFYGYSIPKNQRFNDSKQKYKTLNDLQVEPGPGHYPIKSSLGGNNKILSQDKNVNPCLKLVLPKNESRRQQIQPQTKICSFRSNLDNPQLTRKGNFTTFSNKKGFTLGKSKRSDLIKNQIVPGPGNYRIFSEFTSKRK